MTSSLAQRGLSILSVGVLFAAGGCTTRGTFVTGSCSSPIAVNPDAVSAIYFDKDGKPLGDQAEDLMGTQKNKMCPTPTPHAISSSDPSACTPPPGYCARTIAGKTYCLRC